MAIETTYNARLMETIADISFMAGSLVAEGKIDLGDSREFMNCVLPDLAKEFEASFTDEQNEQEMYMELVDQFAERKLLELYSTLVETMTFTEYLQSEGFEDADDVLARVDQVKLDKLTDRYVNQCEVCGEEPIFD